VRRPLVDVVLGRMRLKVPMIVDQETTLRIAQKVNARLEEVEKQSDRVDSHAFALIAAMSFAAELEEVQKTLAAERKMSMEERTQETKEFFVELDKITETLRRIPSGNESRFPQKK
jgi:cell division protein ZapA (FtsZ GTPase activity inhibitor)